MQTYAKVINGIVEDIIVADQNFIDGGFAGDPLMWIEYNRDGEFRANPATIKGHYDIINDVFYDEQPYTSWTLNKTTWKWEPPIPFPENYNPFIFKWDELNGSWINIVTEYRTP